MAMAQGTRLRLGLCSFKHPFLWNISPSIASTTTTTAGAIQTCLCLPWLFRLLHSNALNPLPQRSPAFHGVRYMQRQLPFQRLFCSEATGDKEKMKKKPMLNEDYEDSVTIRINEKLTGEFPVFSDHSIFKVPKELRSVNEEAYEPKLIAIGPYHHGKDHLLSMEDHKIRYLQSLLQQSSQKNVSRYVQIIRNLEERARKCYAEPFSFTPDEFVEMMLIDGCFIIEFIRKLREGDMEDLLFRSNHMFYSFMLDLLLLENQLPFFILRELLVTSNVIPDQESTFIAVILKTYESFLPGPLCNSSRAYTPENMIQIKNLLGLLHDHWQPSPARLEVYKKMRQAEERDSTRCATELKDAGIKFKSAVERNNLFDIDFVNSTIKIPKIQITDITECVLRNLIAYEQLTSFTSPKYFTDYMKFIDSLINSKKDVELLCRQGIIDNWKGDDEAIAILFNKLGEHVFCESALYADIVNNVNEHCKKRRNWWMAELRHNHFQSPWSLLSFLADIMRFLLKITQKF
ncbi:UPF0481 protein At3g47200 isoform X2 [Manihot esculenta]|uniref:Uncharacterized protein n=2 Tax=Manihot esculenta TaxID=3983 RepID=A0ACB7I2L2_MANES|nr:UPF0481 protein At3g47200 isoform X2 [Manihot esculenta]KAG8658475.1 hypothetical protein MANES_03G151600v8 [Manihot esculenta]